MTRTDSFDAGAEQPEQTGLHAPTDRRRFLGFLVAGPTVAAAAWVTRGSWAGAAAAPPVARPVAGDVTPTPASPQGTDYYDLEDFLTDIAYPTTGLVKVEVNPTAPSPTPFPVPRWARASPRRSAC